MAGSQAGDIYSFGIIMQEIIVRGEPFCMMELTDQGLTYQPILSNKYKIDLKNWHGVCRFRNNHENKEAAAATSTIGVENGRAARICRHNEEVLERDADG